MKVVHMRQSLSLEIACAKMMAKRSPRKAFTVSNNGYHCIKA